MESMHCFSYLPYQFSISEQDVTAAIVSYVMLSSAFMIEHCMLLASVDLSRISPQHSVFQFTRFIVICYIGICYKFCYLPLRVDFCLFCLFI